MTDKHNYKSISLRNHTYSKLEALSKKLVPGIDLSNAKTVEKLITEKFNSVKTNGGTISAKKEAI